MRAARPACAWPAPRPKRHDLLTTGGYALEKIEGFAIDAAGYGFAVTDNDGVNDSNGETLFWSIGKL